MSSVRKFFTTAENSQFSSEAQSDRYRNLVFGETKFFLGADEV